MELKNRIIIFLSCRVIHISCLPSAYIGESLIMGERIQHLNLEANQFLGIPYAEPPVGSLRFMKTEPIKGYPKVFRALHQPPACHQFTEKPFPFYINSTKSENCLFLNIWTPTDASPLNTKAVFYWLHGGGFRYGSIRDPGFNGTALAAIGDIVVVTANYRLGPMGFITSNTEDAPGNAGLWDILEGLKWVNQNILAFGGDITRITIGGESAGSLAVGLLNVSPLSQGLFTRLIMESEAPTSLLYDNNTNNIMLTQYVSTKVNCASDTYTICDHPTEVIQCLKDVDADTLSKVDNLISTASGIGFYPQHSDEILPQNPRLAIINGEMNSKELLSGVTKDEGTLLSFNYPEIFGFFGEKNPHINKSTGQEIMRNIYASFPQSELIVDFYLNSDIKETDYEEVREALFTSFGDMLILCPTLFNAEKTGEVRNSVYVYFWVHRSSTSPWYPPTTVAHFTECDFVFGKPVMYPQEFLPNEVQISLQMIEMWSNFIKNGYPGFNWPSYRKEFPVYKYIGPGIETQNHGFGPHLQNCNFWRYYYGF